MEDLKNKVINSGIWSTVQTFGKQVFQFSVFLSLSRLLGPSIIGIVALADILIELFILFMRFGIPEATIQQNLVLMEQKSKRYKVPLVWLFVPNGKTLKPKILRYLNANKIHL